MNSNGQDIFISRFLTKDEIVTGFCNAFSLQPSEIKLADSIENVAIANSKIKILCITMLVDFDFPMRIDYFLLKSYQESEQLIENIKRMCISVNCSVLVGDNSTSPHSYIIVNEKGKASPYFLTDNIIDKIDNPKPYILSSLGS